MDYLLIDRLQNVQNCAVRLITGSKKHDYITPLDIDQRIIYKLALVTYNVLNGLAQHYIRNMPKHST